MTNVDGLFATDDVVMGTVVLSQRALGDGDVPHIELSLTPNCELVETDDGDTVLVTTRDVAAGEWFTLASEEGDDDEEEEEDEDEEDNQEDDDDE
jgi:hypothetical protein